MARHRSIHRIHSEQYTTMNVEDKNSYFFKKLIMQMVNDLPLSELRKVFKIEKLDPNELDELEDVQSEQPTHQSRLEEIALLRQTQEIEFRVELRTIDNVRELQTRLIQYNPVIEMKIDPKRS